MKTLIADVVLACAVIYVVSVVVGCANHGDGMSKQESLGIIRLDKEYRK